MGRTRKERSRGLSIVIYGATIVSATSWTQAALTVSSCGQTRVRRDCIPTSPTGSEPHATYVWAKIDIIAGMEAGLECNKVKFTEQSTPGFVPHSLHKSQSDVVVSSVSPSKQEILVNGIYFSARKVHVERTITWIVDRITNATLHDELLRDGGNSVIVTIFESNPDASVSFDFPSPAPPPPRRVAPVASSFIFHNHVPTPCGPASEFGMHDLQQQTRSWHRLQKKQSRDKRLKDWINDAHKMQSWRLEANGMTLDANGNVETGSKSGWGEKNLDAFLFAVGTRLLHAVNVPNLSRLACSKEWEESFVVRNRVALKFASDIKSGLSLSREMAQIANTSWWDGKTSIYAMAKDCICEKLLLTIEVPILAREWSSDSLEQNKESSIYAPPYESPQRREIAQSVEPVDSEGQYDAFAEEDEAFTLFQTSLFHDTLRIKIDIESQFLFALVFVWILHYLYLCIVVYVLRDESHTLSRRRRSNRETSFPRHGARPGSNVAHPSPSAPRNYHVVHGWNPVENTTHASDSTHDERELFTVGGELATAAKRSEPTALQSAKVSASFSQTLHEERIASEEAAARTAMGLPEFIIIQPSYLAALCMLEIDTDDGSDSAIS